MNRILTVVALAVLTFSNAFGQDAAQQQIDELRGKIQEILAAQELQNKKLDALDRSINELRDKLNAPQANNNASRDDLKALAEQVQEIEKNRVADRQLVQKELEKLGRTLTSTPPTARKPASSKPEESAGGTTPAIPQKGYDHVVEKGETLAAIVKAYRDQGVKVTTTQVIKANPGLDPDKLFVGKKIFIPDPNAK